MATLLLLQGREPSRSFDWLLALVIAWLVSTVVLFFASGVGRILGERVVIALERLMGMILTTISYTQRLEKEHKREEGGQQWHQSPL